MLHYNFLWKVLESVGLGLIIVQESCSVDSDVINSHMLEAPVAKCCI